MTSRALLVVLAVSMATAPVAAEAAKYQRKAAKGPQAARGPSPFRKLKPKLARTWKAAGRLPRRLNRVRKVAFAGGLGKAAAGAGALGILNILGVVGTHAAGIAPAVGLLSVGVVLAGMNYGMRVLGVRQERRWAQFEQEQQARYDAWHAQYQDAWQAGGGDESWGSDDDRRAPPPRRNMGSSDVAAALKYFGLRSDLPTAELKERAKKLYRRKSRELHPDVAVPRGVKQEVAEERFKELGKHYAVIQDLDKL